MLLFVWVTRATGQEYQVHNWHVEDGLPDGQITAIAQTPDGYLWVGTPKGLARFDGARFQVFRAQSSPGLVDSRICNLLVDREGSLWIGTLDGNLVREHGNKFEPVQPPVPLRLDPDKQRIPGTWSSNIRSDLVSDGEGGIWWRMTGKGITRLKAGIWTVFSPTNGLPNRVNQIACDRERRVWVEADGKLYCFHGDRWDSPQQAVPLAGESPVLAPAAKGGLWVAESKGLWGMSDAQAHRLVGSQWQPLTISIPQISSSIWARPTVLHEDRTGRLWVGTKPRGLCYFDAAGRWHGLEGRGSLVPHAVSCLFEDRQRSIWVGTVDHGLHRLTIQPLTILPLPSPTEEVLTACATRDGAVWVGTRNAGVFGTARASSHPLAGSGALAFR